MLNLRVLPPCITHSSHLQTTLKAQQGPFDNPAWDHVPSHESLIKEDKKNGKVGENIVDPILLNIYISIGTEGREKKHLQQ